MAKWTRPQKIALAGVIVAGIAALGTWINLTRSGSKNVPTVQTTTHGNSRSQRLDVPAINRIKVKFASLPRMNVFLTHQARETMDKETLELVSQIASIFEQTSHQAIIEDMEPRRPPLKGIQIDLFSSADRAVTEAFTLLCTELKVSPKITHAMHGNDVRILIGSSE